MVGVLAQVNPISIVHGQNDVVAVKMLYHAIFSQGNHPAGVLVDTIINDENSMATAQWSFHQYGRIQLKYHRHLLNDRYQYFKQRALGKTIVIWGRMTSKLPLNCCSMWQ